MMGKRRIRRLHYGAKCRRRAALAVFLCGILLLSGCKQTQEQAPELVASKAFNDSYRKVARGNIGDIGNLVVHTGTVVPEEHAYFFNTSARIDEIFVGIGEYVKKGTVLASIKLDTVQESISELQNALKCRKAVYKQEEIIYGLTMDKLDYQMKAQKEAQETSETKAEIKRIDLEKKKTKENHEYTKLMYQRECREMSEEIGELKKQLAEGRLVAREDGYVTYIKDLKNNADAQPAENVVILSDYNKKYLEVQDVTMEDTEIAKMELVYTNYNDKQYELTPYDYSQAVLAMIQATRVYPYLKYNIPEGLTVEVGDMLPVCYTKKNVSDVLIIGLDSVYEEGNETFVYVKNEENKKERRLVTLGAEDEHYVEVKQGLSEGEMVYYSSTAMIPSTYQEIKMELSSYVEYYHNTKHELVDKKKVSLFLDIEEPAVVSEVFVKQGDTIKEGDLVLRLLAKGGKADLMEAKNALDQENNAFKETGKAYRQQVKEIDKQIKEIKNQKKQAEPVYSESLEKVGEQQKEEKKEPVTAGEEEKTEEPEETGGTEETDKTEEPGEAGEPDEPEITADMLYQKEQLTCDKKIAAAQYEIDTLNHKQQSGILKKQYDKLKKINNGKGYINVYAEKGGTVEEIKAVPNEKLFPREAFMLVGQPSDKLVLVTMAANAGQTEEEVRNKKGAALNQKILFEAKDKNYTGVCVAAQSYSQKYYFTILDGEIYSSHNPDDPLEENRGNAAFYVRMEDEAYYNEMNANRITFEAISIQNTIVVPNTMIYKETNKINNAEYNYVWKVENGELVKQYITVGFFSAFESQIVAGVSSGDVLIKEGSDDEEETTEETKRQTGEIFRGPENDE